MRDLANFSKNLKALRKRYNVKQVELAKNTGISKSVLSYYESEKAEPTLSNLIKIAEAFQITLDELVSGNFTNNDLIEEEMKILNEVKLDNDKLKDETVLNDLNKLKISYLKEKERFCKFIESKIKQIDKAIEFMKEQEINK
ncbi:helix-turn-helix domain-containing protein [Clostridium saccharoperbutylacetonicum]|uniref:helix-turn-helix domain-containing protein n=1 Tax=Clostridium saccharoperbutylacetonicum TaxID=36745 RepID=UPI0039EC10FA